MLKHAFKLWVLIASITTVVFIYQQISFELRASVRPDPTRIRKSLEFSIQGRNTETVFQHTFSTELTGDSDLLRIHDSAFVVTPELSVDVAGNVSVACTEEDIKAKSASEEAFVILCLAAADWRLGYKNEKFDTWLLNLVAGSDDLVFHEGNFMATGYRATGTVSVTIY